MNGSGHIKNHRKLILKDFLDLKEWQKIQDNFSNVTEISLRMVDPKGNLITAASRESRICRDARNAQRKDKFCGRCLPTFLGGKGVVDRNLSYVCHKGICNFVIPVTEEGFDNLGYIIMGPVILVMRKAKEEYAKVAEDLGMELDDFWSALLEIKVVSFKGAQALIELIRDVARYTVKLASKNILISQEELMESESVSLSKVLNALLDVAFQVTSADLGSIMYTNDDSSELSIRASRGLSPEIINNTRVKFGEGISGIAALERKSFLLNDKTDDNRLRPYLSRPNIRTSMVLPISVNNRIKGVMNLGTLRKSSVNFNQETLKVAHKLVELAALALQG